MKTKHWSVDKNLDKLKSYPQIVDAAKLLKQNQIVAFPTETVYGLGANAYSDEAVARIYQAKGRPSDNPLIVHISDYSQLQQLVVEIPEKAQQLIHTFWPGPLTLVFYSKPGKLSNLVTAGLNTLAVRMPDHPVALALISEANLPIAAPSANRSGKPSPTSCEHVIQDLDGKIAGIVDGGETGVGLESTVIDCTSEIPIILRPGGVSKAEIEAVIGEVDVAALSVSRDEVPKSPGMKYKHYAPDTPLFLVNGDRDWVQSLVNEQRKLGKKIGVLASTENAHYYDADLVLDCGSVHQLEMVAHSLYHTLRSFDQAHLDMIYSEVFPQEGVGEAIMNRLEKAAAHQWLHQKRD